MVVEVKDYVDKVQEKFPYLSKSEINKLITYGLKRYAKANKYHCDVLLLGRNDEHIYTAHCGQLGYDALKHYWRWVTKWRMKERFLNTLKKKPWDGYYYIGLTEKQHKKMKKGNKQIFHNVYLVKLKKELYHLKFIKHIWRVPWASDCGYKFYVEKLKTDQAEYIGTNKYEEYHQCFLGRFKHGSTSTDSVE